MDTNELKYHKIIIVSIIIMLFVFIKVDADSCSGKTKTNLINEASNIEFIPVLDDEYDPLHTYYYGVNITNLSEKFYILDSNNNRFEFDESYSNDSVFGVYSPGDNIIFKVYGGYEQTCEDVLLTTYKVKFDYYNDYSTYDECKGIEEFYLCKRNYSGKIESEEWFLDQVNGYKEGTVDNIIIDDSTIKGNFIEKIVTFLQKNPIVIILIIIFVIAIITLVVTVIIKSRKKIKIDLKNIRGDDNE